MKITVKASKPKDNKLEATLTVAAADVDAAVKQAYRDIANKYRFQGFRKGKAPRPVIDGLVGRDAVLAQASEELLNEATPLMLEELNVVPVGQPTFGDEPKLCEEGKDYELVATIGLRPEAELSSYDAPEINMPPAEVTDAEVDEQLDVLLSYQASFEDAPKTYKAAAGDMLTIDVENVEGGEAIAGEDRPYMIGSSAAPAEFNAAIEGMKVGETKEVTYKDGDKDVKVKVTLKSAKKHVVPELTDELASKSFGYDTVADLREAVKDEVAEDKQAQLPGLKETRAIEKVTEALTLEKVPEDYVKEVFDEIAQDFLGQLQRQGMSLDAWLSARRIEVSDFLADLQAQAEERARQSLALDALAKKLGFEATDEDVNQEFVKAGIPEGEVAASVEEFKNSGRLPAVRESIKRSKAVDWLVENAKVKEVDEIAERRAERAKAEKKPAKKAAAKKTTTKKAAAEGDEAKKPAAKKTTAKKTTAKKTTKKAEDAE